jgi:hypothetical protein
MHSGSLLCAPPKKLARGVEKHDDYVFRSFGVASEASAAVLCEALTLLVSGIFHMQAKGLQTGCI